METINDSTISYGAPIKETIATTEEQEIIKYNLVAPKVEEEQTKEETSSYEQISIFDDIDE